MQCPCQDFNFQTATKDIFKTCKQDNIQNSTLHRNAIYVHATNTNLRWAVLLMMPAARLSFPHPHTSFLNLSPGDSSSWRGGRVRRGGPSFLVLCLWLRETLLVLLLVFGLRLGFDSGRPGAGSSALLSTCDRATLMPRHVVR